MIRRWWLPIALLLSLGINLGVVAMLVLRPNPPAPLPVVEALEPEAEPIPEPVAPEPPAPEPPSSAPPPRRELARPGPPPPPQSPPLGDPAPGPRFDAIARNLRLDADQTQRFIQLQRRHFERARSTRQRLEAARRELGRELLSATTDRRRVDPLLREIESAQSELDRQLSEMMLESQEFLTPEQQKRFAFFVLERLRQQKQPPARGPMRRMGERRYR
jgi:Spy/CpxP family protein refolding chaperone